MMPAAAAAKAADPQATCTSVPLASRISTKLLNAPLPMICSCKLTRLPCSQSAVSASAALKSLPSPTLCSILHQRALPKPAGIPATHQQQLVSLASLMMREWSRSAHLANMANAEDRFGLREQMLSMRSSIARLSATVRYAVLTWSPGQAASCHGSQSLCRAALPP